VEVGLKGSIQTEATQEAQKHHHKQVALFLFKEKSPKQHFVGKKVKTFNTQ
jgi:hypothetical protein